MKSAIAFSLFTLSLAGPLARRQNNLQAFSGALGGIEATPVEDSGNADRPFQVKDDTFVNLGAALQRSCDQQFNACANAANGGDATLSVAACATQKDECSASVNAGANNNDNAGNANAGNANAGNQTAGNENNQAGAANGKGKGKACKAKNQNGAQGGQNANGNAGNANAGNGNAGGQGAGNGNAGNGNAANNNNNNAGGKGNAGGKNKHGAGNANQNAGLNLGAGNGNENAAGNVGKGKGNGGNAAACTRKAKRSNKKTKKSNRSAKRAL